MGAPPEVSEDRGSATHPPRVVLDTNVLLSALVFARGSVARLRGLWQSRFVLPLTSTATAEELMRVLAYPKFKLDRQAQRELLADYLPWAEVVAVPKPPPAVPACRDPFALPFLHLAVAGRAQVLVTDDADLLTLAGRKPRSRTAFAIVTPATFLASISAKSPQRD